MRLLHSRTLLFVLALAAFAAAPWLLIALRSDGTKTVRFELSVPAYSVESDPVLGQRIAIDGYRSDFLHGRPGLPTKGVLLGVPAEAGNFAVLSVEALRAAGAGSSERVDEAVAIEEEGVLRHQRFIRLAVTPVQYDPAGGLRHYARLNVAISYQEGAPGGLVRWKAADAPPFEQLYREALVNYEQAKRWRVAPVTETTGLSLREQAIAASPPNTLFKLSVERDGIYAVAFDDLVRSGLPNRRMDARRIRLFNSTDEVAFELVAPAGAAFGPGDTLRFYGQQRRSRYGSTNVYWLALDGGAGRRITTESRAGPGLLTQQAIGTVHVEQDRIYRSSIPPLKGADHWYWDLVNAPSGMGGSVDLRFPLSVEPVGSSWSLSATLVGLLSSAETVSFIADLRLNGSPLGRLEWSGAASYTGSLTFPSGLLRQGENVLTVQVPQDLSGASRVVVIDGFDLTGPQLLQGRGGELAFSDSLSVPARYSIAGLDPAELVAYEISDPLAPVRLSLASSAGDATATFSGVTGRSARYFVADARGVRKVAIEAALPRRLHDPGNQADYLLITHRELLDAAGALAGYRRAQGLTVQVIDVQSIYDEFSAGVLEPAAIQRFLRFALTNWRSPAPAYVLLVGDGSLDFKDALRSGEKNLVPPYLDLVDPFLGETASDQRYAAVAGDDLLADFLIGRLPAQTPADVTAMLDKIVQYERLPSDTDWLRRVVLIADNPDKDGNFPRFSDAAAAQLPATVQRSDLYLRDSVADVARVQQGIAAAFREGAFIVNYVGHAAITEWGHEGLFGSEDVSAFAGSGRLPLVLSMTCYDGYFQYPSLPSTSELLVKTPQGGAIASFAATGLAIATGHDLLDAGFMRAVFQERLPTAGAAAWWAKLELYSGTTQYRDLLDTFLLLGDPALRLPS